MTLDTALGTQQRISDIVGELDTIATLPEVVAKITQTINDPTSTAAQLHHIISHDPALVSRLLKLANSSYYARSSEITSVERAITLLGFETVHHLTLAATMGQLFKNIKLCQGYTARDLWTHSIAVAATAKEMAKHTDQTMADQAFLAGLVHDIGLLVLLQVCPDKLQTVCERAKLEAALFNIIELDVIGVDHQELGAALAERWGFPQVCRAVARHHHHPALAEPQWQTITALVCVADALCCQEGIGFSLTAASQLPDQPGFIGLVQLSTIQHASENLRQIVDPAIHTFI